MTNAIETTRRSLYQWLKLIRGSLLNNSWSDGDRKSEQFQEILEAHLEVLRLERCALAQERDDLRNRLQAMTHNRDELARSNLVAGDEMRRLQTLLKAKIEIACTSPQVSPVNVDSDAQKANALMIILGALIDSQRIITDWIIPDGIKPKKAMPKLLAVLDNETLVAAQKVFEKTEDQKVSPCVYCDGLGYVHCNGGRPTAPCPNGCE
jgi:hypothetical protein